MAQTDRAEPLADYNDSLWIFPPTKSLPNDPQHMQVIRKHKETRALTLSNTYNKYVCGATALAMRPTLEQAIHSSQNGFVRGRQLLQNPVDLDLEARFAVFRCQRKRSATSFECMVPTHKVPELACFLLLDFATAFASVAHQRLHRVVESSGMPSAFIHIIRNRYLPTTAYIFQQGSAYRLFEVQGGVMQGCPLFLSPFPACQRPVVVAAL